MTFAARTDRLLATTREEGVLGERLRILKGIEGITLLDPEAEVRLPRGGVARYGDSVAALLKLVQQIVVDG